MARSNRKSRQAPVVADQAIVAPTEATIPEAKLSIPEVIAETLPAEHLETTAEEAIEKIETIEASEPTVADLQADAATGSSEPAEVVAEAPPAGLSKDDWIVPGPCTKRVGTDAHRSFQCYGEGCTVEAYLANKGHSSRRKARESLRWDIARGLVSIGVRPVADEEATVEAQEEAIREVAEVA